MFGIQTRHFRALNERPHFQCVPRCRRKILPDLFFRLLAPCHSQPGFRNDSKNLLEGFCQIINALVVDPGSDEEKLGRNSTREGSHVEKLWSNAVRHQPHAVRRQIVMQLKKEKSLPVRYDTLIRGLEGPAIGRHMIKVLPKAILPPEIVRAALVSLPAHRVISALFEAVHRQYVRRTRSCTAPSPLPPVPKAERRMDIDNIVFGSHLPHICRDSFREFDGTKPAWPFLQRKQVLKKNGLHAVPQLAEFFLQIVDNSGDSGLSLPRHSRDHQNPHLGMASLL